MSNNLTTSNSQLMSPADNQASLMEIRADNKRYPRLHTYTREQAVHEMSKVVSMVFLYKGQPVDQGNIQFISCSLVDELQADIDKLGTKYLSFAEVSIVVKRAVLSSEMYGISVASIYKVIIDYVKGEGHKLSQEVSQRRKEEEMESIKQSIIAPMLQAYTGEFVKNHRIKNHD